MAARKVDELVLAALEEHANEHDLDIVSVEVCGPTSHPTLRVRIDTLGDTPIDMNTVTAFTPWVSEVVDALDPFNGSYELEVSSPGIDRPLRRVADFETYTGETVEFVSKTPIEGRKSWTGTLEGMEGDCVVIVVDGARMSLPLDCMKSCHIKPDFDRIFAAAKKSAKDMEDFDDEELDEEE